MSPYLIKTKRKKSVTMQYYTQIDPDIDAKNKQIDLHGWISIHDVHNSRLGTERLIGIHLTECK